MELQKTQRFLGHSSLETKQVYTPNLMDNTFKAYLQSTGKSKSTVERYEKHVDNFRKWLDNDGTEIIQTTAKEVMAYMSYVQKKGDSNPTREIKLNVIKQFFDYQVKEELLDTNPVKHLKIKGEEHQKLYPILTKQ